MLQTSIFIERLTTLDCALFVPELGLRGLSLEVDVRWHGECNEEGVIVDFSTARRLAKDVIDGLYDHRVLVAQSCVVSAADDEMQMAVTRNGAEGSGVTILSTQNRGVVVVSDEVIAELNGSDSVFCRMESLISEAIFNCSPATTGSVSVSLRRGVKRLHQAEFDYVHGLCRHEGRCQWLHGHSSAVDVVLPNGTVASSDLVNRVRSSLEGHLIVSQNYLASRDEILNFLNSRESLQELTSVISLTPHSFVQYQAREASVTLVVPSKLVLVLEREATIENIATYCMETLLKSNGELALSLYEGFGKGTTISSMSSKV